MGRTAFSGPVYGAKSLLFYANESVAGSSARHVIGQIVVPPGQDWYVTDLHCMRTSTNSTEVTFAVLDDSSRSGRASSQVIADATIRSSLALQVASTAPTPTGGEFEGVWVQSGSTLALTVFSSVAASSGNQAWMYGYIRYVDSTWYT
jgi:hypothetical protein